MQRRGGGGGGICQHQRQKSPCRDLKYEIHS
jgi:hypothetical protein